MRDLRRRAGVSAWPTAAEASLIGALGLGAVCVSLAVARGWVGVAGGTLAILTLAIAVVDRRAMRIPDALNASAFFVGLAVAALAESAAPHAEILGALLRAAIMFLAFLAFRVGYRRVRGIDGIGLGDVKLAAVAGVWLDWSSLPIAVDIAALTALATVGLRRFRGEDLGLRAKLPFGAFLAPAIWLCWLFATWRDNGKLAEALAALSTGR
jgi:leader peptidase (prepilin peptidase) / N-methyltransferase